jgi:hypothetical protein
MNEADATFCISCGNSMLTPSFGRIAPPVTAIPAQWQPSAAAPSVTAAPPPAPAETEALNYSRFVDMLCEGQNFLAQLAIRFYYITGLKTYQVTDYGCFVVPNLRRKAAEITTHIKREMEVRFQELLTTFLYMRIEHIETMPYLSNCIVKNEGSVPSHSDFTMAMRGGVRLFLELFWGFVFVLVDFLKWIGQALSQSAGAAIRTAGHAGNNVDNDEMLTGKRLMLASTYRHTRTYTYVHTVGPETYIGWFTHHEPPPGILSLFAPVLLYFAGTFLAPFYLRMLLGPFAELTGAQMSFFGPLSIVFGIGGILYILWFAPWLLNKLGALPQPRYISSLVFALWLLLGLFGAALIANGGSPDTFMMILSATASLATVTLLFAGLIVFLRVLFWPASHFDQFDAETHAKIVEQIIALSLAKFLDTSGYSSAEIQDILEQRPAAGRYRPRA